MKIFTNIKQFDLSKPLKPWLRKVMVNTAINRFKEKQRETRAEEMQRAIQEAESESIISGISYQEIIGMLHKLPPAYRTVFNLHVIEGYKHEEIAGPRMMQLVPVQPSLNKGCLGHGVYLLR